MKILFLILLFLSISSSQAAAIYHTNFIKTNFFTQWKIVEGKQEKIIFSTDPVTKMSFDSYWGGGSGAYSKKLQS
ncbi:MAG: hypothetical protein U9O87_11305 [Verrucomicrobiota bacterium]|nr:hypothetical protein [Verrucomicrobiota bacterium]